MKWGWIHFECHALRVMIPQDHKEDKLFLQKMSNISHNPKRKKEIKNLNLLLLVVILGLYNWE